MTALFIVDIEYIVPRQWIFGHEKSSDPSELSSDSEVELDMPRVSPLVVDNEPEDKPELPPPKKISKNEHDCSFINFLGLSMIKIKIHLF